MNDRAERLLKLEGAAQKLPEEAADRKTILELIFMFRLLAEKGTITDPEGVDEWIDRIHAKIEKLSLPPTALDHG